MTRALLHQLVEAQVRKTPGAVALESGDARLTYAELDARANSVVAALRERGVGPETIVGLLCERSVEMIIGLLGVLKAGGAYLPLDPEGPPARAADLVADSGTELVLVQAALSETFPLPGPQVLVIEDLLTEHRATGLESTVQPENIAYLIYTSGSTGRPKGVLNQHRPVCNRILWGMETYPMGPGDAVLQKTPIQFDVSVWEIFWPLSTGARLVLARPGGQRDPEYLVRTVAEREVTTLHFVPSMLPAFLERLDVADCSALTRIFCSGEALTADLQEAVLSRLPVELHNLYGPTEAAIEVSHWTCVRDPEAGIVPIGHPIGNARLHVLNGTLRPVAAGAEGDLYLGGLPVARGYHRRAGLTAERFVADPFGPPGARMYRSGDRARLRADGCLEFLGRDDDQIKLRGFRIELGEIEAALRACPQVLDSVVVLRGERPQDQRLVGYVTGAAGEQPDAAAVLDALAVRLPSYMVPSELMFLDQIPRTTSGKIDRHALPEPPRRVRERRLPPQRPVERQLAQMWAGLLDVERPDLADGFVALGGNSLLAARLVAQVAHDMGVAVPVRSVFTSLTLADFAAVVETAMAESPQEGDSRQHPEAGADSAVLPSALEELTDEQVLALLAELEAEEP